MIDQLASPSTWLWVAAIVFGLCVAVILARVILISIYKKRVLAELRKAGALDALGHLKRGDS
jgi:hypothetical protein